MASKLMNTRFVKSIPGRQFAAQAATASAPEQGFGIVPKQPCKTTTLKNGLVVASVEDYFPLSRVGILFRAGARYETRANSGITHHLRVACGLQNGMESAFGIAKNMGQLGGIVRCTGDRDYILYSLDISRQYLERGLQTLRGVSTMQTFLPWEQKDLAKRFAIDLGLRTDEVLLLEDLHRAAYRNSDLANSLFAPEGKLAVSSDLKEFTGSMYLAGRAAVVGTGVDHDALVRYAEGLELPEGAGPQPAAKYGGGEIRTEAAGSTAHVAVVAQGAGAGSPKDVVTQAVLQGALGLGSNTKRGNPRGTLGAAAVAAGGAATSINAVYADSGLLGWYVVAPGDAVGSVVAAVNQAWKSGAGLDDAAVKRAKQQVKAALLAADTCSEAAFQDLATQAALGAGIKAPGAAAAAVDAVTAADVKAMHKKLVSGKLSMACRGDLSNVPYLDEL